MKDNSFSIDYYDYYDLLSLQIIIIIIVKIVDISTKPNDVISTSDGCISHPFILIAVNRLR